MDFVYQPAFCFFMGSIFGAVIMAVGRAIADDATETPQVLDSYSIIQMKRKIEDEWNERQEREKGAA